MPRVVLVGDAPGVVQSLRALPADAVVGIVAASNRPQYHDELAAIASRERVPLLVQPAWQSAEYVAFVRDAERLRPELFLCNSYSMLLRPDLLALPAAAVNAHGGRLPEYRGPNPIQWQIVNGEREAGVTLHHLVAEIDAGDVIAERRVPIRLDDTWRAVSARIAVATDELLATELPAVLAGTAPRRAQDETLARNWPRRQPADGRIDWSRSVLQIHDLIRALGDGIPPAFYERDGEAVLLDGYHSLADVFTLAYAPGPGGRRLERDGLSLVPVRGPDVTFAMPRGRCGIALTDPQRRVCRVWSDPHDDDAISLLAGVARDQLRFEVQL
jgi:methionyl-tRNA formyltransferase